MLRAVLLLLVVTHVLDVALQVAAEGDDQGSGVMTVHPLLDFHQPDRKKKKKKHPPRSKEAVSDCLQVQIHKIKACEWGKKRHYSGKIRDMMCLDDSEM